MKARFSVSDSLLNQTQFSDPPPPPPSTDMGENQLLTSWNSLAKTMGSLMILDNVDVDGENSGDCTNVDAATADDVMMIMVTTMIKLMEVMVMTVMVMVVMVMVMVVVLLLRTMVQQQLWWLHQ